MELYDLNSFLDSIFYSRLQSKKAKDRKDAVDSLSKRIKQNPHFELSRPSLNELAEELIKILHRDLSLGTATSASSALTQIARTCKEDFRRHAAPTITHCLMRLKETKPEIRNVFVECLDASYATTTDLAAILMIIEKALINGAAGTKLQTCEFFTRIMLKAEPVAVRNLQTFTQTIMERVCKLSTGRDTTCKVAAQRAKAAFLRAESKMFNASLLERYTDDVQDVQNLNEYFDQFLLEHPYPKEVVYEEEIAANNEEPQQRRRKRRATMFHSLISLNMLDDSPEPEHHKKTGEKLEFMNEAVPTEEYSSFIEIIEYDENGREKKKPIDFNANDNQMNVEGEKENEHLNENKNVEVNEILPLISTTHSNTEIPLSQVRKSPNTIVRYEKARNGHRKLDPTLLKTPPTVPCLKSINPMSKVNMNPRKKFRFADIDNEAPLCDIKEVDYEADNPYGFRQSTKKKTMFGEVL